MMRSVFNRAWIAVMPLLLLGTLCSAQTSDPPCKVPLILAETGQLTIGHTSIDQLYEMFPDFQPEEPAMEAFNTVALPFHYSSSGVEAEPALANAMAFLLSASLDWTPVNYCGRHAYFVFKRARRYMEPMQKRYDPNAVAFALEDWCATHAVGGELHETKAGFTGTLQIYDTTGKLVHTARFNKPQDFFGLLGDMTVDAMKYFGYTAPPTLVKHLHRARCKHRQSLVDLGEAAFVEEKTPEEFKLYEDILQRDPGFADVRYWWANQKIYWTDGNRKERDHQYAKAMDSYLIEPPLNDYDPRHSRTGPEAKKYEGWLEQAEKLVGADSPVAARARMGRAWACDWVDPNQRQHATLVAQKYPNDRTFLRALAATYGNGWDMAADKDMANSIYLAALQFSDLPGLGDNLTLWKDLAINLKDQGHPEPAASIFTSLLRIRMKQEDVDEVVPLANLLGDSFMEMGQYEGATDCFGIAFQGTPGGKKSDEFLVKWAVAAGLSGNQDKLEHILRKYDGTLERLKVRPLVTTYQNVSTGLNMPDTPKKIHTIYNKTDSFIIRRQAMLLLAQLEIAEGKDKQRNLLTLWLKTNPTCRQFWILKDAYERLRPTPISASFYESLAWLHGDDPWVVQVVADYKQRVAAGKVKQKYDSAEQLLEKFKDFPPHRWPAARPEYEDQADKIWKGLPFGSVATTLKRLIDQGDFKTAEELGQRYLQLARDTRNFYYRVYAHQVYRRMERARQAAEE